MLFKLKVDYLRRYPSGKKLCELIVLDLSWATIHAACNILNNETFTQYNNRIYKLAQGDMSLMRADFCLLASCALHTMHRVTLAIKVKNLFTKDQHEARSFGIHCFSMMLNCQTLGDISAMFKLTCICFMKTEIGDKLTRARRTLQSLIADVCWITGILFVNQELWSWQSLIVKHVLQADSYICGFFISYFFKRILEGNLAALELEFDTQAFRLEMGETITNHN